MAFVVKRLTRGLRFALAARAPTNRDVAAPTSGDTTAAAPLGCTASSRLRRTGSLGSNTSVRGVPQHPRSVGRPYRVRAWIGVVEPYIVNHIFKVVPSGEGSV